jgi:endo-1,3(4)-beta-glucanase
MNTLRMARVLVCLAACFGALSARAAVLPMGAGSIADTVNPAGYGCVIDYGYWIHSAGVVQPGIAGCDPLGDANGVPVGTPTKIYPQLVGPAAARPTATHRWWGMVPFYGEGQVGGSGAGYLTADPIYARVSNRGLRVLGLPNGLRTTDANQFQYPIPGPSSEVFDGIAIGNTLHSSMNAFMKDSSDGSITVEWRSGSTPVMEATLVHGSPYVFFEVYSGTPVIRTKAAAGGEKGVFVQAGNTLGVWTNVASIRNHFMIVGDGATTFTNPTAAETPFEPANRRFTLVWLPVSGTASPTSAMISEFQQYALNRVARVNIGHAVDPASQAVTVTHDYLDANGASVTTMAGLMPLQWKRTSQPLGTYKTRSARGVIRFTPTHRFDYRMPFVGVLPLLPNQLTPADDARLRALVSEFVGAGSASWNARRDTYWSGKAYGKVAEVAAIARSLGMTTEANTMINWLKSELQDWFTAGSTALPDRTKYFSYDRDWATLLGFEESFGAQQQLNDHHFHYGYFIRAAAEVCRVDASWCGASAYGPVIELLIRDFAAGRDDPLFPYLRNFDPANGFSWASGHANFALGNNNESTSEAANAYGAIILYGLITGKQDLVDRGVYLHASTTAAYWEYWNNLDAFRGQSGDFNNFPAGYNRLATSIIWGAGGVFSTWFSGATAHILGIQGLPLNPLVLHIGQHTDYLNAYVTLGLSQSSNGQPSGLPPGQWTDIWWNILSMTDAQRASNDFDAVNLNYTVEEGETKAHTFHWIQAFKALGQVESGKGTLTADYPAAVAFKKNGLITYLAYNLGSRPLRVTFSDGMALNVPARTLGTKRTGDTPDPIGGSDSQPPTPPGTPSASRVTATTATLVWAASTDNVAVTSYLVTTAGGSRATATASIELTGLASGTQYPVSVVALDAAGNRSSASSGFFATTAVPDTQAPTTPGALVASNVTSNSATLSWPASTDNVGVTGYEVRVGSNTVTSVAPTLPLTGMLPSTLYQVELRALDAAGNRSAARTGSFSTLAAPCTSNCPGPLPAGWTGQDIGNPTPGTSGFTNGVFTSSASGSDIWGTADSFRFVHQTLSGDGQITARVDALDVTDAWAKAGLMMRATLASNSPHAMMAVTGSSGTTFQHRVTAGGTSVHVAGPVAAAPYWVRLVREGNVFTGFASTNGSTWTRVGAQTIVMPATLFAGMAHTSHRNGVLGNASFSSVAVAGPVAPSPTVRYVRLEALSEVNGGPWASLAEFNLLDTSGAVMSRTGWVVSADSQATGYPAGSAVDGNPSSIWHTPWSPSSLPMPHSLVVDLGSSRSIGGFRVLPRQGTNSNGRIANWRLQTSTDGIAWTTVAQGTFAAGSAEQTVMIPR